jgi:1-deoxy-D-xylulose-5-phosphate reductoisomerase
MKNIYILGATGSIGMQTIDVIKKHKNDFKIIGMSMGRNDDLNHQLLKEFNPEIASLRFFEQIDLYKSEYPNIQFVYGDLGLLDVSRYPKSGLLVNALSGSSGLMPTIEAIKSKKDILLANKETLVMAGKHILKLAKAHQVKLYPIDSEHNALWQIIENSNPLEIDKIVITASGGSFRDLSREELKDVQLKDALKHPNWNMGAKITIDSATMVNKGLEVIEAHYLFDLPYEKIETILHKESVLHGLIYYIDGTIKASLSVSDMRIPIAYALFYPKRNYIDNRLDLKNLTFKEMDFDRYPLLKLAYQVGIQGGLLPTVYNASNEAAVNLFLDNKIKFIDIEDIVSKYVLEFKNNILDPSIDLIIETDLKIKKDIYLKHEKR